MSGMKPTKGPWKAEKPEESNGYWYIGKEGKKPIIPGDEVAVFYKTEVAEANARLASASPELLKCLREACKAHHSANGTKPPQSWLLVIAKAEGRA